MTEVFHTTAQIITPRSDECDVAINLSNTQSGTHLCRACEAQETELFEARPREQVRNEHRGSRRVHGVILPECMKDK
ncbi:MAG: hypothetical protein JWM36_435 [Hyphomicrobiales bacterium]|nr:hypothetical protein [Hyphomicrobiales bacterium]